MAWELWGPPFDPPVAEETSFYTQPEFYLGHGFDVIEEDALNEKCCVQVMKILITKADDEINELEQDLVFLQSELAWIENEEWQEMCCNTLREKINYLDISINNLRNKEKNDVEVHLLMHTQPAETLHQILKGLLIDYIRDKDHRVPLLVDHQTKDVKDAIVVDSILDAPRHGTNVLKENKRLSECKLEGITDKKSKESSAGPAEHSAILNSSLKPQEKKTNNLKTVKPAYSNMKDSKPHSLKLAAGHSDEKKLSSNFVPKGTGNGEARECGSSPEDKRQTQNSPSKSADKESHSVDMVKIEPANIGVSHSITDPSEHAVDHSYKKKKLSDSDSVILNEVEEHSSISTADVVTLGSPLKPAVKKTDLSKKVKPTNTVAKDLSLNANRNATGHSNEIKKLCKPDLKLTGNEEVREHCSRAVGKIKISRSSVDTEGQGNHPRTDKLADAIVKNVSEEALTCATGLNVRIENSGSGLGTLKQAESSNSDIEQKLCDIAAMHKRTAKESKLTATDDVGSLNSYLKKKEKKKTPLQIVRIREAGVIGLENCALTSPLELQDQKGQNAAKLQPEEERKPMAEVQLAEVAIDEELHNLDLSVSPQNEKAKRSIKSNPPILQETGFSKMVAIPSPSYAEGKKRQKSGAGLPNASLNQSLNGKITKEVVHPGDCEAKEHSALPDDNSNSVSERQMKRKKCANFPITKGIKDSTIQMDFSNSCMNTTTSTSEDDLSVTESSSICDSSSEVVASLPSAIINLNELKMVHLRAIAKEHKLTRYSKLRKNVLIELIADRIGNC